MHFQTDPCVASGGGRCYRHLAVDAGAVGRIQVDDDVSLRINFDLRVMRRNIGVVETNMVVQIAADVNNTKRRCFLFRPRHDGLLSQRDLILACQAGRRVNSIAVNKHSVCGLENGYRGIH